jgi:hypothetical protein
LRILVIVATAAANQPSGYWQIVGAHVKKEKNLQMDDETAF